MGVLTRINPGSFRPLINFPRAVETMPVSRYLLTIYNPNGPNEQFIVRMEGGITRRQSTVVLGNSPSYLGRFEYDPITIKIMDTVGPTSPEFFRDWMMSGYESTITGRSSYATNHKRTVKLERINPVGDSLETWDLFGCQIQEMRYEQVWDNTVGDIEIRLIFDNIAQII